MDTIELDAIVDKLYEAKLEDLSVVLLADIADSARRHGAVLPITDELIEIVRDGGDIDEYMEREVSR